MITQERLKQVMLYDKDTGKFTWLVKRGCKAKGQNAGNLKKNIGKDYIHIHIDGNNYYAHRLAFLYVNGEMPKHEVDHINGNGTDNSWKNLRQCSSIENKRNMRLNSRNTSGYCGVSLDHSGFWRARINVNKTEINLGRFKNIEDAINARKEAEIKYNFHDGHGIKRPRYGDRDDKQSI